MRIVKKGYDFDDLLMIPRFTRMDSRREVDLSTDLGNGLKLDLPIIGSPMKGIMSETLAGRLASLGAIGILHRFISDKYEWFQEIFDSAPFIGVAVGLNEYDRAIEYLNLKAGIICIDVADGYLNSVIEMTEELAKYISNNNLKTLLMSGNVADANGFVDLANAGANLIRVGIGPGHLCTTRNVTGVGVPQLTAIDECVQMSDELFNGKVKVIADGGIRNSGDMAKALAMGAHAVMIGSLLAKANESANNGIIYGMASQKLQEEYFAGTKSIEGLEEELTPDRPLESVLGELEWGLRSACTYMDAHNLKELKEHATWIETGSGSIKKL